MVQPPTDTVRREIDRLLQGDDTRVGDVYRLSLRGLNPSQIAQELSVNSSNFVSNNRAVIKAVLEGQIPGGPKIAHQVAASVRRLSQSSNVTPEAKTHLLDVLHALERAGGPRKGSAREARVRVSKPQGASPDVILLSLRRQLHDRLLHDVNALVERIKVETGIDADDYYMVVTGTFALDEVVRLVSIQSTSRTTKALHEIGRLDLSIEQAVVDWALDLPITADLVSSARGRLAYWRSQ